MEEEIKKIIAEEKWKRWHNAKNLHLLSEQEPTRAIRKKPPGGKTPTDPTTPMKSVSGRRPVEPKDVRGEEEPTRSNVFVSPEGGLTPVGKAALKANSVWTNNTTQLMNFQAGKRLSQQLGRRLAKQINVDAATGERIADAVMKQVLETLDELATQQMEKEFPGIFNRTWS